MTAVTSGYMANPNTNSSSTNKNGPATNIPSNPNTNQQEAEDLIKSTKSTMQQLIQAQQEIIDLKEQLVDREARLIGTQQAINDVLKQVAQDSNTLYKEINKSLVIMSDMVKSFIEPSLQQQLVIVRTQIPRDRRIMMSNQFRQAENIHPLDMSDPPKPPQ